jgi:hypothetical protein
MAGRNKVYAAGMNAADNIYEGVPEGAVIVQGPITPEVRETWQLLLGKGVEIRTYAEFPKLDAARQEAWARYLELLEKQQPKRITGTVDF